MRQGRRARLISLVGVFVLFGAIAPGAMAATVNTIELGGLRTLRYAAGAEVNDVTASQSGDDVTFTDPGAVISGSGSVSCNVSNGGHTATCSHPGGSVQQVDMSLAGGADEGTVTGSLPGIMFGGNGDDPDVLTGAAGKDDFDGGNGSDTLTGGNGDDVLDGGGENDTISGGGDDDEVLGDTPGSSPGLDVLSGGSGDDVIDDGFGGIDETLNGGSGDDRLTGDGGDDTLNGSTGNDRLDGGDGNGDDVLNGGADVDIADYRDHEGQFAPVTITIDGLANDGANLPVIEDDNVKEDVETVWGTGEGDTITGDTPTGSDTGADSLQGFGGPDDLRGAGGPDKLFGGSGPDTLDGGTGPDELRGQDGTDTATYAAKLSPVFAHIDGFANDGTSREGDNVIADVENLIGGQHNDTLIGDDDLNALSGGDGGDSLKGGGNEDVLNGNGSNDTLDGGTGNDDMNGGDGFDTADYSNRILGVAVDLDNQADDGTKGSETDNVHGDFERVWGGSDDDFLVGNSEPDALEGRGGEDLLEGKGAGDTLDGGDDADTEKGGGGDDLFVSGPVPDGPDVMVGAEGADRVSYASRTGGVTVTLAGGADDGESGEGDNVQPGVENATGGSGGDTIVGSAVANGLNGGPGGDDLDGLGGDDALDGAAGTDQLKGGGNADRLVGGPGPDDFDGGGSAADLADYSGSGPVSVTINDVANDGTAGELDNVHLSVERLLGSRFDDLLIGSNLDNVIEGGLGADDLQAEGGADTLKAQDGTTDQVGCGNGVDTYFADPIDNVKSSCETAG